MAVKGEEIGEIKSKVFRKICYTEKDNLSNEIIFALAPEYTGREDELMYEKIFPYMKINFTDVETSSFIMIGVNVPQVSTVNYFFKEILISIMVVVHEDNMRMKNTNRTRADYIGERINRLFNGADDIVNGEELEYVSDVEGVINAKYHTRTLRFRVQETNNVDCPLEV